MIALTHLMKSLRLLAHTLLTVLLVLLSSSSYAKEWAFDVYLDKTKIGEHIFNLSEDKTLTSRAKFNVKLLFIMNRH